MKTRTTMKHTLKAKMRSKSKEKIEYEHHTVEDDEDLTKVIKEGWLQVASDNFMVS